MRTVVGIWGVGGNWRGDVGVECCIKIVRYFWLAIGKADDD